MRKGKDPEPNPYLWLMNPVPRGMPQHCPQLSIKYIKNILKTKLFGLNFTSSLLSLPPPMPLKLMRPAAGRDNPPAVAEAASAADAAAARTPPGSSPWTRMCHYVLLWKQFLIILKLTDHLPATYLFLKGPQVFTQIRSVWVGNLETRPKNSKFWCHRLENHHFVIFSAVANIANKFKALSMTALKNVKLRRRQLPSLR